MKRYKKAIKVEAFVPLGKVYKFYDGYKADEVDADKVKDIARIQELEEELADYKEGTEGLKLCVGDLRNERDRLRKVLEEIVIIADEKERVDSLGSALADTDSKIKRMKNTATKALKSTNHGH